MALASWRACWRDRGREIGGISKKIIRQPDGKSYKDPKTLDYTKDVPADQVLVQFDGDVGEEILVGISNVEPESPKEDNGKADKHVFDVSWMQSKLLPALEDAKKGAARQGLEKLIAALSNGEAIVELSYNDFCKNGLLPALKTVYRHARDASWERCSHISKWQDHHGKLRPAHHDGDFVKIRKLWEADVSYGGRKAKFPAEELCNKAVQQG